MRMELPILLATGLRQIVRVIQHPNAQLEVRLPAYPVGDVDAERGIPPFVSPYATPINEDDRVIVDRPEVQHEAPGVRESSCRHTTSVPAGRVETSVAYPTARGLGSERNHDGTIKGDVSR
jgi:hypothetical protein